MSHLLTTQLASANLAALDVLAAIPDPGQGEAPPGSDGFLTVLGWAAWVVFGLCVAGLLVVAGKMAIEHNRQGHVEVTGGVVKVLAAAVIAGSASAIIGAVLV